MAGTLPAPLETLDEEILRRAREALLASGRYQLLERFAPRAAYHAPDGTTTKTALFVDVETTGLTAGTDAIIQLAVVPFSFDSETGRIFAVEPCRVWYEDPGTPISPEVTRLTGITDADVAGQRIDDATVAALLARSVLVLAHNAAFDRAFLEARLPAFCAKAWACSQRDIDWTAEGFQSARLEWLAFKHCAMFYGAHRADEDCLVAVHLLTTTLPVSGRLAFDTLLRSARRKEARIWAINSPFETKDVLKARGYRWCSGEDGTPKAWYRDVEEASLEAEQAWLASEVYRHTRPQARVVPFDARLRYSPRMMRLA